MQIGYPINYMNHTKHLTIGMATYDDFHGVYFSLQSLRLQHPNLDVQYVIIDNNPNSTHGNMVEKLAQQIGGITYVKFTTKQGTSARNEIFKHAKGKYTLCMDSHVLFPPGSIESLLSHYERDSESMDIISGPMLYDNLRNYTTQFEPIWGELMYGRWHSNKEACEKGEPFEIPMMGLGAFSCRTAIWPGFNENFRGFGGEEGYIHELFRQRGGKCLCVPGFKWLHRFGRPDGVPYSNIIADRVWNYYIGWFQLLKTDDHPFIDKITEVFSKVLSQPVVLDIKEKAKRISFNA